MFNDNSRDWVKKFKGALKAVLHYCTICMLEGNFNRLSLLAHLNVWQQVQVALQVLRARVFAYAEQEASAGEEAMRRFKMVAAIGSARGALTKSIMHFRRRQIKAENEHGRLNNLVQTYLKIKVQDRRHVGPLRETLQRKTPELRSVSGPLEWN